MPLTLVSDNQALFNKIVSKELYFEELSIEKQESIIQLTVASRDFSALEFLTNSLTGIFNYDDREPYWLERNFNDDIWVMKLSKKEKIINWNEPILDDGERLTSKNHQPLLNAFKYWITSLGSPLNNGGKLLKLSSIRVQVGKVIHLINAILLNAQHIDLAKQHFSLLSNDFVMDILVRLTTDNGISGIYDYHARLHAFLSDKILDVTDEEGNQFSVEFPYTLRQILPEERLLPFTREDRIKACTWLNRNDFYQPRSYKLNNALMIKIFFSDKIICLDGFLPESVSELDLSESVNKTEFSGIPVIPVKRYSTESTIRPFMSGFKNLLAINNKENTASIPIDTFNNINFKRINQHARIMQHSRFRTLPAQLVFTSIENAYNFCFKYMDSILESAFNITKNAPSVRTCRKVKSDLDGKFRSVYPLNRYKEKIFLNYISDDLLALGVEEFSFTSSTPDCFIKRRDNKEFIGLYNVLMGSIQILIGALMARRKDELVSLNPIGNLLPNIEPTSDIGKKTDYTLTFGNKKSGIGGEHEHNQKEVRPIPRSLAVIIYKMERFNQTLIDEGLQSRSKLALCNQLYSNSIIFIGVDRTAFDANLDSFCDYFETDCIQLEGGEHRRYYIRQHQLRRFFAMVFFWSKSFDGLDTLRWMLGHTDIEHLYHYVTETQKGEALNGVKASYLVDKILTQDLENIEMLKKVLAKRYGVNIANVSLSTVSEAVYDFGDGDYQTIPTIDNLHQNEKLESQILELLKDD
ncbi:hypothetical protein [Moritella viscosa]|uniref:Site-specific recombinase, phage integrase family domain protein n=1 Tax=Moritella viscosa TaxID=80854 RepID=A0A1L0AZB3_9GAMM|nr:hypothetical protein [Moritella viscosa]SGY89062.1 Site-specific recombinase, phage integrase family domain protein [Moritella viscosa]